VHEPIVFPGLLYDRLVAEATRRNPRKTFGYLLSDAGPSEPSDFVLFEENIRNSQEWQPEFHSYGHYFVDHADAGFVATPAESWRVQKEIWARGLHEVGVLHSHQRHPANFSRIDWEMHRQRFCDLWHLIISLRNPQLPQVRAFAVADDGVRELPLRVAPGSDRSPQRPSLRNFATGGSATGFLAYGNSAAGGPGARAAAIERVREVARTDAAGRPALDRAAAIIAAIGALRQCAGAVVVRDVLAESLLRDSARRYEEHIAPLMTAIGPAHFEMGTDQSRAGHFYGESPRHACDLPAFGILRVPVTAGLFSLISPVRAGRPGVAGPDRNKPVVSVTWAEAALFALWMGCRLPTEAEWEYCCGAGSPAQWCCESERQLPDYAWYSVNTGDQIQLVGTRQPNSLGLFDMHGNVWEWCLDDYDQDFYRRAPRLSPVRLATAGTCAQAEKVVRGGSMNGLAEMCRTRYRFHEPAGFRAADLGFRLAHESRPALPEQRAT
jgi:formylglycine-generating enzyme required for sulfatase activity/proteasome lid subunit RPN8/RPN11